MKTCTLSEETQKELYDVLVQIEKIRIKADENNDFPHSDFPYRPCQAIIAEKLGFDHRAEWAFDILRKVRV